ncbi:Alcohol dehydrogenase GroES-like domain-containing protein 4 [Elsinoe fawcettii]|nr:Alcohol dehydrogenase GroES-like domain-containing protein 4 [Elsinoe fawcettii]
MPNNKAAFLLEAKAHPFVIRDAPMPKVGPTQIGVKIHAAAVNPSDPKMQHYDMLIKKYPFVLGIDGAGEVYEVGSEVTIFKPGDRILGMFHNMLTQSNENATFMHYAAVEQVVAAKIPDNISYEQASVLPAALCTAASGMYQDDGMGLPFPSDNPKPTGKVALVWGGSSSVGAAAIQLFRASGYEVAAVAGPANQDFCKDLGAKFVFNYKAPDVFDQIRNTLKDSEFGGAFDATLDDETILALGDLISQLGGHKALATVKPPGMPLPREFNKDVKYVPIFATTLMDNAVGPAVFGEWVSKALASGQLKCKPDPFVFGRGLEAAQGACDKVFGGVSAQKVVVQLP